MSEIGLRESFLDKVMFTDSCWIWTASLTEKGYGQFRGERAHRVAYRLFRGPIPEGLIVRHTCNTPCCVSPAHLKLGTDADNTRDMLNAGRNAATIAAVKHANTKLTETMLADIRAKYAAGATIQELADEYKVSGSRIAECFTGQYVKDQNRKLTDEQVADIRKRYAEGGCSHRSLAKDFGVSQSRICEIVNNKARTRPAVRTRIQPISI